MAPCGTRFFLPRSAAATGGASFFSWNSDGDRWYKLCTRHELTFCGTPRMTLGLMVLQKR
eukprot:3885044-Rhodomonas_salina.1